MTTDESFWNNRYSVSSRRDKVNKHSSFVEFVLKYFPKKGKILELGSWKGEDALFLSQKGYSVTATDFSQKALEALREKTLLVSPQDFTISYLNLNVLFPFSNHSFDIVYANLVLHYFDKQITQQIFDEIFRVLKPKGIVAITTNSVYVPEYGTGKKLEEDYFEITPGWRKRYFSTDTLKPFISKFQILILDDKESDSRRKHKENIIRFIGKKR